MTPDLQSFSRTLFAAAEQLWTNNNLRPDQYAQPVLALSRGALLVTGFYLIWAAPRLETIIANPLAYDDFYIGTKSPQDLISVGSAVYLYSWRPVLYLEYRLFDTLLSPFGKPFVFTVLPKLIGGLFVSIAATLAYRVLRSCEVARPVAFLCLAVFVVHPVVNEISLWNTVHAAPLALCFALLSDRLLASRKNLPNRIALASASAVLAVLTYQFYLIAVLIMAALRVTMEGINSRQVRAAGSGERLAVFCVAAVLYLAYMWISTLVFDVGESRGLAHPESLSAFLLLKFHGIMNLLVNVTMPIVSYYSGIASGWKYWEAPFLAAAACTVLLVTVRRDHIAVAALVVAGIVGLPILAALPTLVTSQSPEAWRISVPATLSFALSLAALGRLAAVAYTQVFKVRMNPVPWIVSAIAAALAVAVGIVAHHDAQQRVLIHEADLALTEEISRFWAERGTLSDDYFVGRVTVPGLPEGPYYTEPPDLTSAYGKAVPPSAFDYEFFWRGFLAYRGMHSAELDTAYGNPIEAIEALCARQGLHCVLELRAGLIRRCIEHPDYIQDSTGRRVVHVLSERLSVVCGRPTQF